MRISDWSSDVCSSDLLAIRCDIREEDQVQAAVAQAVAQFGGIDILVNNASAIWLRGTLETPMKRFDLMQQVNARGSFLCAQVCLPHLLTATNPHILTLAQPPSLNPRSWGAHTGYTLAKMRSEEHTSELQSLMHISYAVFRLTPI